MTTASSNPWAVILAAEEGSPAIAPTGSGGEIRPLWAPRGGKTLLRRALERAERAVPRQHIAVLVDRAHRERCEPELAGVSPRHVVAQPAPRGSAAALLLPLLHVHRQDPGSTVLVLPAHHHVEQEWALQVAIHRALDEVGRGEARLVLLAMTPQGDDEGGDWVMPSGYRKGPFPGAADLLRPSCPEEAARLLAGGGLLSSSILVASTRELVRLFRYRLPQLTSAFEPLLTREIGDEELARRYDEIPCLDLGQDLLPRALESLAVLAVPPCGWSDLSTPQRMARCLEPRPARRPPGRPPSRPNLLRQLAAARRIMEAAVAREVET
jgi:mannose-1-phosphate guanylyltransferase